MGTDKVMNDHSTIGMVITTDGSFGELPRSAYEEPEERTIVALKKLKKPFLVLVNSQKPYGEEARRTAEQISGKYHVSAMPVNCEQLKKEDIHRILENVLYEFPLTAIEFYSPRWVELLPADNRMKQEIITKIRELMQDYNTIRDVLEKPVQLESDYIRRCKTDAVELSDGVVKIQLERRTAIITKC